MPVELTPNGTYGARSPGRGPLLKLAMALGSAFMRMRGIRVVQLATIGAQSGQQRTTDLIAVPDGPDAWIVMASSAGSAKHPAWYFNMARHSDQIWLRDGDRRVRVEANNVHGEERDAAFNKLVAIWKSYAGYVKKTDRQIPLVRLTAVQ
jgi:deazaflavin-dependent oxidoreductase (nitroreductase family)